MKHSVFSLSALVESRMVEALKTNTSQGNNQPIVLHLSFAEVLGLMERRRMTGRLIIELGEAFDNTSVTVHEVKETAFVLKCEASQVRTTFNSLKGLEEYK